MNNCDPVVFGGPNSIDEFEAYFRARTEDIPRSAFNEIEAELSRLKEAQERRLSDLDEFDGKSNDTLHVIVKRQLFERRKLFQIISVRWGSNLAIRILVGLGYDLSDYSI